jgi:hypothetical protein
MNTDTLHDTPLGLIASGIPLPPRRETLEGETPGLTSILRQLQVGDCVRMPRAAREGVYARAAKLNIKVSVRRASEDTVRIWRTA